MKRKRCQLDVFNWRTTGITPHGKASKPAPGSGVSVARGKYSAAHHRLVPDPLKRGGFVAEALDVDSVLMPDQFDVLMRDPEFLGISQQGDSVLRIRGKLLEVREEAGSLDRKHGIGRAN